MAQAHISHIWLPRYAARLLNLVPGMTPRKAVGFALSAFPDTADIEPETAAGMFANMHAQSSQSSASAWLRSLFTISSIAAPIDV
jgi:hypothetical protein